MKNIFLKKSNSLKSVLLSTVFITIFLLTLALTLVSYFAFYDSIEYSYINQMKNFNKEFNREINSIYQSKKKLLVYLSKDTQIIRAIQNDDKKLLSDKIQSVYKDIGGFVNVFIASPGNDSVILADALDNRYIGEEWTKELKYKDNLRNNLKGKIHISFPAVSEVSGLPVALFSAPIFDEDGKIIGIYGLVLDLYKQAMDIIGNLKIGKTGYPYITDKDGIGIAHPAKKMILYDFTKYDFIRKNMTLPDGSIVKYTWEGKKKILTSTRNESVGIITGVTINRADISEQTKKVAMIMIISGILISVLAVGIVYYILDRRLKPLHLARDYIKNLSKGQLDNIDVTKSLGIKNHDDEIGEMLNAVEELCSKLLDILKNIIVSINELSNSATQLEQASQDLSNGASEQAASVEQTTTSLEEITATVVQNADNATLTSQQANHSVKKLQDSGKAVKETLEAMKQISKKITVIEEIASQTNLLSVNAAIEAAKAGEQGQGFAVVAMEVRKLSDNSCSASGEILELANDSILVAQRSGDLMQAVVPEIQKVTDLINEIASASNEQKIGLEQVNLGMNQLSTVAQQNASSSEELASTSMLLHSNMTKLKDTISFFKI